MRLRTVTGPILSDAMPLGSHFPDQDPVRHPANPQGSFCSSRYAFSALPRWHGLLRYQRFVERFTRHQHGPHDGQQLAGRGNNGNLVALPLSMHHAFVEGTKCRAVPEPHARHFRQSANGPPKAPAWRCAPCVVANPTHPAAASPRSRHHTVCLDESAGCRRCMPVRPPPFAAPRQVSSSRPTHPGVPPDARRAGG